MGVKIAEAGKRNYTGPISSAPISLSFSILVMVISLLSGVCHVAIIAHYQTIFQGLSDFVSKTAYHELFLRGPEDTLRVYLEQLAEAQNVQEYVVHHPFGQRAITESDLP